jgi:hypothetical protein
VLLLIDVGVLLAILLWALGRVPSWYRPLHLSPEEFGRVSDELAEANNHFARRLFERSTVTQRLTQQQINEWLIVSDQLKRWLPDELSDPMVVIRSDRIVLAAVTRVWGMEAVVSIAFRPIVEPHEVRLELLGAEVGSLRFKPQSVEDFVRERLGSAAQRPAMNGLSVQEVVLGATVANRFRWPNGGRHFQIERVELEPGRLTIRVLPERDHPADG